MKIKWNFLAGGERGAKQKTFHWGEYGYFLELHIRIWNWFFRREGNLGTWRKTGLGAGIRTNNKLNPHIASNGPCGHVF